MYCFEALNCKKVDCPVKKYLKRRCWLFFLEKYKREPYIKECPFAPCDKCHYKLGWEIGLITDNLFSKPELEEVLNLEEDILSLLFEKNLEPDVNDKKNNLLDLCNEELKLERISPDDKNEEIAEKIDKFLDKPKRVENKRFCWEIVKCYNPNCPVREQQIIRCYKYFERKNIEKKLEITKIDRFCDVCVIKKGWEIGILNEALFADILEKKKIKPEITTQKTKQQLVEIYLKEISKKPLSKEEEIELAKKIAGDKDAAELFLMANLKLVVRIAKSFTNRGLSLLDLIQEGNIGLIKAISKFDWTLGYKFSTYAAYWIRYYMQKAVSEQTRIIRIPYSLLTLAYKIRKTISDYENLHKKPPTLKELSKILNLEEEKILEIINVTETPISIEAQIKESDDSNQTLEYLLVDKKNLSVEEEVLENIKKEECQKALSKLPERLKEIVELHFGFREEPLSLAEIGKRLNISRERVRQLLAKALQILKENELVLNLNKK